MEKLESCNAEIAWEDVELKPFMEETLCKMEEWDVSESVSDFEGFGSFHSPDVEEMISKPDSEYALPSFIPFFAKRILSREELCKLNGICDNFHLTFSISPNNLHHAVYDKPESREEKGQKNNCLNRYCHGDIDSKANQSKELEEHEEESQYSEEERRLRNTSLTKKCSQNGITCKRERTQQNYSKQSNNTIQKTLEDGESKINELTDYKDSPHVNDVNKRSKINSNNDTCLDDVVSEATREIKETTECDCEKECNLRKHKHRNNNNNNNDIAANSSSHQVTEDNLIEGKKQETISSDGSNDSNGETSSNIISTDNEYIATDVHARTDNKNISDFTNVMEADREDECRFFQLWPQLMSYRSPVSALPYYVHLHELFQHGAENNINKELLNKVQELFAEPTQMCAMGASFREQHFIIDKNMVFINQGAFGSLLAGALYIKHSYEILMEHEVVEFMDRHLLPLIVYSIRRLSAFIRADPRQVVFVQNATFALNAAMRLIDADDVVAFFDTEYLAVYKIMWFRCEEVGAKLREIHLCKYLHDDTIMGNDENFTAEVLRQLPASCTAIVLDLITSTAALHFPLFSHLIPALRRRGVNKIIVDGAHGPMQVELNFNALPPESQPSVFVGNLHKWFAAPKSVGFMWVRKEDIDNVNTTVISHGAGNGLLSEFIWDGTRDYGAYLTVPAILDFWQAQDCNRVRSYCTQLLHEAVTMLTRAFRSRFVARSSPFMSLVELPEELQDDLVTSKFIQDVLHDHFNIEVPVKHIEGRYYIRVSAFVYNTPEEYVYLKRAILLIADRWFHSSHRRNMQLARSSTTHINSSATANAGNITSPTISIDATRASLPLTGSLNNSSEKVVENTQVNGMPCEMSFATRISNKASYTYNSNNRRSEEKGTNEEKVYTASMKRARLTHNINSNFNNSNDADIDESMQKQQQEGMHLDMQDVNQVVPCDERIRRQGGCGVSGLDPSLKRRKTRRFTESKQSL